MGQQTNKSLFQNQLKVGLTVKRVRLDKGMRAKDVYDGIVSRSSYFRFENGQHNTNVQNLMAFLSRMQVGISEFVSLLFYHSDGYQRVIADLNLGLEQAKLNCSLSSLRLEQRQAASRYHQTGSLIDYHNMLRLAMYIEYFERGRLEKTACNLTTLNNYLFNIDHYYQYELNLFISICQLQPLEILDLLLPRAMRTAAKIINPTLAHQTPVEVLNHAVTTAIHHQNYHYFKKFVRMTNRVKIPQTAVLAGVGCRIYRYFLSYCEQGHHLIEIKQARECLAFVKNIVSHELVEPLVNDERQLEDWLLQ
ncbi:helix-turn-helix domain-containing protein [Lentilactobacillus raoultii]|uniref:Helix-turn-helix domain-containing protein n=1 Tax=Lentilactobacillus raoultii TaxID=1987503 RepID=A0ABW3PUJ3_9LACO|nr:helix-turn-helix transcriptional regulator [Lentilactobacillus raoultii]